MTATEITTDATLITLLHQLYPTEQAQSTYTRLVALLDSFAHPVAPADDYFSERTVTLITYGDSMQQRNEAPLATLHRFLNERLKGTISTVHILPFYPYSSDDGFSVIDYHAVNPALGTWDDISRLGHDFRLMFDAVINHMSVQSEWFKAFLRNDSPYREMFYNESPAADLSSVVRPRTSPLLTPFQRANGETAHVWTTFSADQVDLDFRSPETLLKIMEVLLHYIEQGANVIRLDAIAFLWKQAGTRCLHLPETHAVIQLFRAALNRVAPHVILISETNVPHGENISYFGDGYNEAQLVYNFTLPPLLLHTLLSGKADLLCEWINSLHTPSPRTAFFNFTASHDGIGVRPVEGILTAEQLYALVQMAEGHGGRVSYRSGPDGQAIPYELNVTYVDAAADPAAPVETQVKRFLLSQAVMLAMAGVPAIYIHSLLGSRNDAEGVQRTGQNRSINRAKLSYEAVQAELDDANSFRARIFRPYLHLIQTRIAHKAFHPGGTQQAHIYNNGQVLGIERTAPDNTERVLALFNMTDQPQQVSVVGGRDLLSGETLGGLSVPLEPYAVRWLQVSAKRSSP